PPAPPQLRERSLGAAPAVPRLPAREPRSEEAVRGAEGQPRRALPRRPARLPGRQERADRLPRTEGARLVPRGDGGLARRGAGAGAAWPAGGLVGRGRRLGARPTPGSAAPLPRRPRRRGRRVAAGRAPGSAAGRRLAPRSGGGGRQVRPVAARGTARGRRPP